jgi:hypothetical protein
MPQPPPDVAELLMMTEQPILEVEDVRQIEKGVRDAVEPSRDVKPGTDRLPNHVPTIVRIPSSPSDSTVSAVSGPCPCRRSSARPRGFAKASRSRTTANALPLRCPADSMRPVNTSKWVRPVVRFALTKAPSMPSLS